MDRLNQYGNRASRRAAASKDRTASKAKARDPVRKTELAQLEADVSQAMQKAQARLSDEMGIPVDHVGLYISGDQFHGYDTRDIGSADQIGGAA